MGLFNGCLLASDIDGTLLSNGYLPERNVEKIKYFLSEGGTFSLSTGRTPGAVSMVLEKLGTVSPSVFGNGSMIYDFSSQVFLHQENLPEPSKEMVAEILEEMSSVGIEAHSGTEVLLLNETPESIAHEKYENIEVKCIDYKSSLVYNWNKVVYMLEGAEQYEQIKAMAEKYEKYADFVVTSAVIEGKIRHYFEQVPKGVSKHSALIKLCEMLKINEGCFYAIGDYYNDVLMLKAADISAVPSDSPEDIKALASTVVTTACDGAVADFIDYLTKMRKEAKNGHKD